MKLLFTYTLLLLSLLSWSQSKKDSLINIISHTNDNFVIAETCYKLSKEYDNIEKDDVLKYIEIGIIAAKKIKNYSLIADLYFMKAILHDYYEEWDISKNIYYKSAKFYQLVNDSVNVGKCYINTGVTQYCDGNYEQAVNDYNNAVKNLINSNEFENIAKAYNNLALVYKAQGNYRDAINTYIRSLKIKEKIGDKPGLANTYQNIGVLFWEQENFNMALNNYYKAANIFEELKDTVGLGSIFGNIGLIHKDRNDTAKAMKYYNESIKLLTKTNYIKGLASAILNKGVIIDETGNFELSEQYFLKSLGLCEKINYYTGIMINKVSLSRIYSVRGERKKSLRYAEEAMKIAEKSNSLKYLSELYLLLSKNYIDVGQYKSAYNFLSKYHTIKDSLFTLEKNKQITEIQTKYETDKKEAKIILLEKESEIKNLEIEKNNKRLQNISITLILTLGFLVILVIILLQKRKAYLSLVEHNIELAKKDIENEEKIKKQTHKSLENIRGKEKYSDSQLSKIQKRELLEDIVILMEEEKFFLNTGFTVNDFAKKLKTNRNYISQVINEYFNTNFNNFINEYRVKEARKLLINEEYKNYSIEGIALTVGFNTKATFNSAFKKFTGVTPSFFQKNTKNIETDL